MQLVKGHGEEEVKKDETERKINFQQAYQVCHIPPDILGHVLQCSTFFQDAVLNEVDSGTELDSQGDEEEQEGGQSKDDTEEKDDWNNIGTFRFLRLKHAFYYELILHAVIL